MIRATYPSYLGPPLRGPSFYGARYCALIRPRGACRLGGEMYEPVRGPWFVVREPPAAPPARRSACPPIRGVFAQAHGFGLQSSNVTLRAIC